MKTRSNVLILIAELPVIATLLSLSLVGSSRTEQALQDHFQRGGDYAELTLPTNLKGLRMLAGLPTSILVLTQGLPGCIPAGVSQHRVLCDPCFSRNNRPHLVSSRIDII